MREKKTERDTNGYKFCMLFDTCYACYCYADMSLQHVAAVASILQQICNFS